MKNRILTILLIFTIIACTKEIIVDVTPQLKITVLDSSNTVLASAKVSLYLAEEDWFDNKNIAKITETDSKGVAFFENLQEKSYFFYIEKDNENNRYGIASIQEPLQANQIANITVKLQPL